MALVEQAHLPLLDARANRGTLERGDPADAVGLAQRLDGLAGDHAAVADQHHLLDPDILAQPLHLGHEGLAVGHMILVHRPATGQPRVVQHHVARAQVAREQPVHRGVQIIFVALNSAFQEREAGSSDPATRRD